MLDGGPPTSFSDPPSAKDLVTAETIEVSFDNLLLGHAYGIAWTWA